MAENRERFYSTVKQILSRWTEWRRNFHPDDGVAVSIEDQHDPEFMKRDAEMAVRVTELMARYETEIPTFSPRYMGHMLSEVSLPAMLGHWIALLHNPNNVASEASRVGVQIEKEAIQDLNAMVGWDAAESTGHFTSGGSVANFEALFRARELFSKEFPEEKGLVFIPKNRHYSWLKGCKLVGIPSTSVWQVALNEYGQMDSNDLSEKLDQAQKQNLKVMLVVSVMGSTELGSMDPVHGVNEVLDRLPEGFRPWHHVDAAYGGFFCSIEPGENEPGYVELKKVIQGLKKVNSITIDPHKLAYVPFSCGAFLCRNRKDYCVTQTDAPYLEHHTDLDRGLFTLEGSRSATGPTAMWLTSRTLGLNAEGLGRILRRTVSTRTAFEKEIALRIKDGWVIEAGATNVLTLVIARQGEALSVTNERMHRLYDLFSPEAGSSFILSKTVLKMVDYEKLIQKYLKKWGAVQDTNELFILRFCLLNPFLSSRELEKHFFEDACREMVEKVALLDQSADEDLIDRSPMQ